MSNTSLNLPDSCVINGKTIFRVNFDHDHYILNHSDLLKMHASIGFGFHDLAWEHFCNFGELEDRAFIDKSEGQTINKLTTNSLTSSGPIDILTDIDMNGFSILNSNLSDVSGIQLGITGIGPQVQTLDMNTNAISGVTTLTATTLTGTLSSGVQSGITGIGTQTQTLDMNTNAISGVTTLTATTLTGTLSSGVQSGITGIGTQAQNLDMNSNNILNITTLTAVTGIVTFALNAPSLDRSGPGTLTLGDSNATKIEVADESVLTEIKGTLEVDTTKTGLSGQIEMGSLDSEDRRQIWHYSTNDSDADNSSASYASDGPIIRCGSSTNQGDSSDIISEGAIFYGQSSAGGAMDSDDFSFAQIKPLQFQLRNSVSGTEHDVFNVSNTTMTWREGGATSDVFNMTSVRTEFGEKMCVGVNSTTGSNLAVLKDKITDSTSGGITLSASRLVNTHITRTGQGGGATDTLADATDLVTELGYTNTTDASWDCIVYNGDGLNSLGIAAGTGGTLYGTTTSIPSTGVARLVFHMTSSTTYDIFIFVN